MPHSELLPSIEESHTTTFRLRLDTFEWLQERARANERSVSAEVRTLIVEAKEREEAEAEREGALA